MGRDVEMRRERWPALLWDWVDSPDFGRWFERSGPLLRAEDRLRIEQQMTDDTMVIRAEIPGIDPDKDVEITLSDDILNIHAERSFEKSEEQEGLTRSEFRYGSFTRAVRVPREMGLDDVTATCRDGILEVRFPYKVPTEAQPRKVNVTRS
jgi:HSP20 family protein